MDDAASDGGATAAPVVDLSGVPTQQEVDTARDVGRIGIVVGALGLIAGIYGIVTGRRAAGEE